jgi:hypothetical protein
VKKKIIERNLGKSEKGNGLFLSTELQGAIKIRLEEIFAHREKDKLRE